MIGPPQGLKMSGTWPERLKAEVGAELLQGFPAFFIDLQKPQTRRPVAASPCNFASGLEIHPLPGEPYFALLAGSRDMRTLNSTPLDTDTHDDDIEMRRGGRKEQLPRATVKISWNATPSVHVQKYNSALGSSAILFQVIDSPMTARSEILVAAISLG
jgi:hypothetical protein